MRALVALGVSALVVTAACSDDPASPTVEPPSVTFASTSLSTPFFTPGSAPAPTVAWNGDTGSFALAPPLQGMSVDPTTGEVSWGPSLPMGTSTVDVVATNSAGSATVSLTVESRFQGRFVGAYNGDPGSQITDSEFEMIFDADGTMSVLDVGTNVGEGTWTRSGTTVTSVYSYNGGASFFTVVGEVTHSATEAVLAGFWYRGDTAAAGSESGYLEVSIIDAP